MITPQAAKKLIDKHSMVLESVTMPVANALGFVLAEEVRSPIELPAFDNSAMDGFAVRAKDTVSATPERPIRLRLGKTVYAGDAPPRSLPRSAAHGIMTGAPLAAGADSVIAKEDACSERAELIITSPVRHGRHVRRRGEEIEKGAMVLRKGDWIHPGTVACLATVGRGNVRVIRLPRVSVITTGDEAVPAGTRLKKGQIYDSNSPMLGAMLEEMRIRPIRCTRIKDHYTALSNAVGAALSASDVLIVSGGVSVGDRDYVKSVLARHNVKEIFWRVRQKPGKPLYFGVRGKTLVFGLPGNPASAFTCFYVYVYPALRRLSGFRVGDLVTRRGTMSTQVTPDPKKWRFLKAESGGGAVVTPMKTQGSHMITSLPRTDSLIVVPPDGDDGNRENYEVIDLPCSKERQR
ncbi:MAG: molybdopterin molybdotransferase MoeA [bacterium]|nr:molybdopterin molybdotransferase MoeA [bacterium]